MFEVKDSEGDENIEEAIDYPLKSDLKYAVVDEMGIVN